MLQVELNNSQASSLYAEVEARLTISRLQLCT